MSAPEPGDLPPAFRWHGRVAGTVYGALFLIAAFEVGRRLGRPGDYVGFVAFGKAALAGRMPYDPAVEASYLPGTWATWPPSFAPIAAALSALDGLASAPSVLLFQLLNLAGLGLALAVLARWLYGARLSLVPGEGRVPLLSLVLLGGLLVPFRLVLSNFEHTQSNLLILGLALLGLERLRRKRRVSGGLALGLATAFKATPLALLPYLAWRGRWKDLAAATAGCAVAWGILPVLLLGPGGAGAWYRAWWVRATHIPVPRSSMNQSLLATLTRLLPPGGAGLERLVRPAHAPPLPTLVFWAMLAALLAAGLLAFGRPGRDVPPRRAALEIGTLLVAVTLASPYAWKAHFVTIVPLAAALFAFARLEEMEGARGRESGPAASGEPPLYGVLLLTLLVVNFTASGLIGRAASRVAEGWGAVTWPALGLIVVALRRLRAQPASTSEGSPSLPGASSPSRARR